MFHDSKILRKLDVLVLGHYIGSISTFPPPMQLAPPVVAAFMRPYVPCN